MLKPVLVTPPANDVLDLGEVKEQLNIDWTDDDGRLTRLIAAATSRLDGWSGILGRCLITQTWSQSFAGFASRCLRLPLEPVQQVDSVTYIDSADAVQTVAAVDYRLHTDALGAYVVLAGGASWPGDVARRDDAVTVTFTAGFGDAGNDVPPAIRHAMLMMIDDWNEHRGNVGMTGGMSEVPMPASASAMLAPWRRVLP